MGEGVITNIGLEFIAKNTTGVADNEFVYLALGTDPTSALATDTALGAENTLYGSARKLATCTYTSTGISTWNALFSFTGDVTVREVGLFDASSGGNMLYRRVLSSNRNYADGDAAEFTVSLTFARA